jgi:protein-disulfide isomerase
MHRRSLVTSGSCGVATLLFGGASKSVQAGAAEPQQGILPSPARREVIRPVFDPDRPYRGTLRAPVTIVEYGDFQCPFTDEARKSVEATLRTYRGTVRYAFKHLPLDKHGQMGAVSSSYFEAVAGIYPELAWKYFDRLFRNRERLGGDRLAALFGADTPDSGKELRLLRELTEGLGVRLSAMDQELLYPTVQRLIRADILEARGYGFQDTPTFVVNGIVHKGMVTQQQLAGLVRGTRRRQA